MNEIVAFISPISETRVWNQGRDKTIGVDGTYWLKETMNKCKSEDIFGNSLENRFKDLLYQTIDDFSRIIQNIIFVVYIDAKNEEETEDYKREVENCNKLYESGCETKAALKFKEVFRVNKRYNEILMEVLTQKNIRYILAPHSVESQLVYLLNNNYVDEIVTNNMKILIYLPKSINIPIKFCNTFIHTEITKLLEYYKLTKENFMLLMFLSCRLLKNRLCFYGLAPYLRLIESNNGFVDIIKTVIKRGMFVDKQKVTNLVDEIKSHLNNEVIGLEGDKIENFNLDFNLDDVYKMIEEWPEEETNKEEHILESSNQYSSDDIDLISDKNDHTVSIKQSPIKYSRNKISFSSEPPSPSQRSGRLSPKNESPKQGKLSTKSDSPRKKSKKNDLKDQTSILSFFKR